MLELSYIAGFFDGEGSVGIHRSYAKNRAVRYELQVALVNTDPRPLWEVQKMFGGGVYLRKHLPKHKDTYHWTLGQRASETFLKAILPWLIVKKARAELALEFMVVKSNNLRNSKEEKVVEIELRRTYYERMKALNAWHLA